MKSDVAIVGAGPAGSVAAFTLARAGVQVTVLERATFPRPKTCGDGVSGAGLDVLRRIGLGPWADQFLAPAVLRLVPPNGRPLDVRPPPADGHCYGRTIPRRQLDARLAQAAVEAGAHLVEGTPVREVSQSNGSGMTVVANGLRVQAQMVILADGSHAPVTRTLGLVPGGPELMAVRQYMADDAGPAERLDLYFTADILPGYVWVFPLGQGRVNVGTGTFFERARRGETDLKAVLAGFVVDRLAHAEPVGPVRGYPLRTQWGQTHTHAPRTLVAGDAAGLVSPLSGEGIAPAMESGEMAATHALAALERGDFSARALAAYTRDLEAHFGADRRAARLLRLALRKPRLLGRVFDRLRQEPDLALLVGHIILGHRSPRLALRPATLFRLICS